MVDRLTRSAAVLRRREELMLRTLRKLCARPRHGEALSSREIARACNFDHQTILLIERSALRKMRLRLPRDVRAEFDEYLARGRRAARPKTTSSSPKCPA